MGGNGDGDTDRDDDGDGDGDDLGVWSGSRVKSLVWIKNSCE